MTADVEVKVASLKRALLNTKSLDARIVGYEVGLLLAATLGTTIIMEAYPVTFMNINSHVQQFIKMLLKDHSKRQNGMLVDGMDLLIGMLLAEWIFDRNSYELQVRPPPNASLAFWLRQETGKKDYHNNLLGNLLLVVDVH